MLVWGSQYVSSVCAQVNQIGTVTESVQAQADAFAAGWHTMVSHRSGETEDSFIADLVVALGTGQVGNAMSLRALSC